MKSYNKQLEDDPNRITFSCTRIKGAPYIFETDLQLKKMSLWLAILKSILKS